MSEATCMRCHKRMNTGRLPDEPVGGECASCASRHDDELQHELAEAFLAEFRDLVRSYCNDSRQELLALMQDRTSCYNPYVWAGDYVGNGEEVGAGAHKEYFKHLLEDQDDER